MHPSIYPSIQLSNSVFRVTVPIMDIIPPTPHKSSDNPTLPAPLNAPLGAMNIPEPRERKERNNKII